MWQNEDKISKYNFVIVLVSHTVLSKTPFSAFSTTFNLRQEKWLEEERDAVGAECNY